MTLLVHILSKAVKTEDQTHIGPVKMSCRLSYSWNVELSGTWSKSFSFTITQLFQTQP